MSASREDGGLQVGDDRVGGVRVLGQKPARRIVLEELNFAERYEAGDLQIHLHLGTLPADPDGELLFRAIPQADPVRLPAHEDLMERTCVFEGGNVKPRNGRQGDGVLRCIRKLAESDKLVTASGVAIPSGVWLKAPESVVESRWITRRNLTLRYVPELGLKVVRVGCDGKMEVADVAARDHPRGGASGVVESVFDVPEGVTGELANFIRHDGHSKLEEYVSGLRISIEHRRIGVAVEKGLTGGIKALNLFARPTHQLPGTREGLVSHAGPVSP